METEERRQDDKKAAERWPGICCGGTAVSPAGMMDCCSRMSETHDCRSMMSKCMRTLRWLPLVPLTIGIVLLVLGYYFAADTTRVLWMSLAGLVIFVGVVGMMLAGRMKKMCCHPA